MTRLFTQIYLGFLATGLLTLLATAGVGAIWFDRPHAEGAEAVLRAAYALGAHPTVDPALQAALTRAAEGLDHDLVLWDAAGRELARTGGELPYGPAGTERRRGGHLLRLDLPDGRRLGAQDRHPPPRGPLLALLLTGACSVGLGTWPLARRVTRRLERVEAAMEAWGAGDLRVRVAPEGRDEVARVARTFNAAADRVQQQIEAQRRVLASASHELRSPLARLRMAVELLAGSPDPALAADAARDIEELDATLGDLLQVGRMQALDRVPQPVPVDLGPLLAEEAERVGATLYGPFPVVPGDPRALRRLARNLLENARRHGAPPIEVRGQPDGFTVEDAGPGIPPEQAERLFEPFYRPPTHHEGEDGGVGLGLHLVREIARFHQGEVRLAPRPAGACFRVQLPGGGAA